MKKILFLVLFMLSISMVAQKSVNDYKYVVVLNKFDFLKKDDQYQTSSLTKFLFNKYGYTVYLSSEELPEEINANRCSTTMFASIENASNMITTKLKLVLKDCYENIIYKTDVGRSKEKEFKKSYHEAIRGAFLDTTIQGYKYIPKNDVVAIKKTTQPVEKNNETPTPKKLVVTKTVTPKTITPKATIPKKVIAKKVDTPKEIKTIKKASGNILYAQPRENGYQLVDMSPKVVFQILKTNSNGMFIIKDKNGILYKQGSVWIAEFYENGSLTQKEFQVKF